MSTKPSITSAILIEKAQAVKDKIAEIDREASQDDSAFRRLIKEHFRPDLKTEIKMERR
jgi:hypothetical protein